MGGEVSSRTQMDVINHLPGPHVLSAELEPCREGCRVSGSRCQGVVIFVALHNSVSID